MTILGSDGVALSLLFLVCRVRDVEDDLLSLALSSSLCLCRWALAASQDVRLRDNLLSGLAEFSVPEWTEEPADVRAGFHAFQALDGEWWGESLREGDRRPSAESEELDSGEPFIKWFWPPWKHKGYFYINGIYGI